MPVRYRGPYQSVIKIDSLLGNPALIRPHRRQLHLDRFVVEYPPLRRVDDEHLARLEPTLRANVLDGDGQRARFRREHHEIVGGDDVARRAKSVAIEHRRDLAAVGERDGGGSIPRLHQRRVILVERRRSADIAVFPSHASGMSIAIACASGRPARVSSSSTLSSEAESL